MIAPKVYAARNQSGGLCSRVSLRRQQHAERKARRLMSCVPLYLFIIGIMACKPDNAMPSDPTRATPDTSLTATTGNRLLIRVGQRTFTATLQSNATATAFKARLPLTVAMRELNGNEKYGELSPSLPTNAANPGTIGAGDLMLYGSSTLVLFYETFRTTYRYTKIGRVDNPSGLAAALGTGNVTVSFSTE